MQLLPILRRTIIDEADEGGLELLGLVWDWSILVPYLGLDVIEDLRRWSITLTAADKIVQERERAFGVYLIAEETKWHDSIGCGRHFCDCNV